MFNFIITIRYKQEIIRVYEQAGDLSQAFHKVINRYPDCAFVSYYEKDYS